MNNISSRGPHGRHAFTRQGGGRSLWGRAGVSTLAIGIALAATPAGAQDQAAPPPGPENAPTENTSVPAVGQEDTTTTADIVVTAQKRRERLQDVPIAISVVNTALLASTNSRNFAELQGTIPSVYFAGNSGGGRTYITLRGATGLALNTGDEPVAIYMDDVYLARGVTVGMADLLDVGSIEIVRGPQGTLQGRNATAGAILLRSADPTDAFEGRVSAGLSDPLEFRAQGAVSVPLGGGFRARVAGGYVYDRGWAYNPYTGKHIGGARSFQSRGVLTYDNDGPFQARVVVDYSRIRNEPAIFRYAATTFSTLPTGRLVPVATPNTPLPQAQRDEIFKRNRISLNPGSNTVVKTGGISAKLTYDLGSVDLISVTGFRKAHVSGRNDSDGLDTARQGFNFNNDKSTSVSEELRLQSSGSHFFNYIVGAYYFHEKQPFTDDIYNLMFTVPTNIVTRYSGTQKTSSYAGFADATVNVTDQLSVIGGLRYTRDHKTLDAFIQPTNLDTRVATTTPYLFPAGQIPNVTYKDTSYRAKLVYRPASNLMLYAGYGKGFRAGGFNPFAIQAPYRPEINKSAEIGAKGSLFDRRLDYSVAAYRNVYTNLQLRAGVPTGGAIITNAANSRIKGVEVELSARPTEGLRLTVNGAYTKAIFTSFPRARDTLDREVDATGNSLPRTPKWQFFVSAAQDFPLSDAWKLTAEANYRWRDKIFFYFTNQNDQPWQDPSGGELGARITAHTEDNRMSLSLFGTNLTNERIINTAAITFSYPQVGLNKPRVVGVSGEYRF